MNLKSKGMVTQIGLFGRKNAGRSSLLKALAQHNNENIAAAASDLLEKPLELPLPGNVLFIDTSGVDDAEALGGLRIAAARPVMDRADLAVIVTEPGVWDQYEELLIRELTHRGIASIIAVTKADLFTGCNALYRIPHGYRGKAFAVSAVNGAGLESLVQAMIAAVPYSLEEKTAYSKGECFMNTGFDHI
jgi:predicted GTPase